MAAPPALKLTDGQIVAGKYRVERVVAVGGMGAIAAAFHLELQTRVAIKVLLDIPDPADDDPHEERFIHEARAISRLKSEHVIRVFDVDRLPDGTPFMVLEYLEGVDLEMILEERGTMPIADAVEVIRQASLGLGDAHAAGIVHRDVKPANLFLTKRSDGRPLVKVLDFGIAKQVSRASVMPLTAPQIVLGSTRYMSPEQLRGEEVSAASDVWGLGVTLYELLVGMTPFDGATHVELTAAILKDRPSPPSARRPGIPPALDALVLRCLQHRPKARPEDGRALAAALANVLGATGDDVTSAAPSARQGVRDGPRSRRDEDVTLTEPARPQRVLAIWVAIALASALVVIGLAVAQRPAEVPRAASTAALADPTASSSTAAPDLETEDSVSSSSSTRRANASAAHPPSSGAARPLRNRSLHGATTPPGPRPTTTAAIAAAVPAETATTPPPSPSPPPSPAPAPTPRFALATARVDVGAATNAAGAKTANVTRAVAGSAPRLTACYREALPRLTGATEGPGVLHVETNEEGVIVGARIVSAVALAPACVTGAVAGRRVAEVDTGRAQADVPVVFHGR